MRTCPQPEGATVPPKFSRTYVFVRHSNKLHHSPPARKYRLVAALHESDVFSALCMGWAVSWNRQDCNRQSMQLVLNTWSTGTALYLNSRTQKQFSKQPFPWFRSQEITKGHQSLTAKPATAFPEFVYISVIVSYVFASNCYESSEPVIVFSLIFSWQER